MEDFTIKVESKLDEIYHCLNKSNLHIGYDLYNGACGTALFNFYYARYKSDQEAYNTGFSLVSTILDNVNGDNIDFTFSNGLAGIGWTIEHLAKNDFFDFNSDELLSELDNFLYPLMINQIRSGNYDFMRGGIGIGLYFLNRRASVNISQYIHNFVDALDEVSEKSINGIKWISVLYQETGEKGYNISLSHGIASIIEILSRTYKYNINRIKSKYLLEGAIKYLLNQKLENGFNSIYPALSLESTKKPEASRLAWCYGDLGISVALWHASQALGRKDWEEEAILTFHHAAKRRDFKKNRVIDARICHGTAGIAHIFHRMYLNTGVETLKETADFWFKQTIDMAKFEDGLAGYKTWRSEEYGGWHNSPGLLQGVTGIGLALLSVVSDDAPSWDECLLLS